MIRLLPLLLLVSACMPAATVTPPTADTVTLSGTVTYRQRIALPPDAVATVRLQDDAGGTIAEARVPADGRQVPLPFALRIDRARIVAGADYRLHAQIRDSEGQRLWTTGTPQPVFENIPGPVEIVLAQASSDRVEVPTDVRYRLIGFVRGGEAVMLPPGEPLTITFYDDASYSGSAG